MRMDSATVTVVVVEKKNGDLYRVACKSGVLSRCLERSSLVVLPRTSAKLVDMESAVSNWETLPRISIRQACIRKTYC